MSEYTANETLSLISAFSGTPEMELLEEKLSEVIDFSECSMGHIMAALVHLLISEHIAMSMGDDEAICEPCTNESLTELLQAIRTIHTDIMVSMEKKEHDDNE